MSVFVECKPDEAVVVVLGVPKRFVTHFQGKDELCKALQKHSGITGVVDEDPLSAQPSYLKGLRASEPVDGVRLLADDQRNNRLILLCPRLEEWLFAASRETGLSLQDAGFLAKDGRSLHWEINQRINSLQKLLIALLEKDSKRLLRFRTLLTGK